MRAYLSIYTTQCCLLSTGLQFLIRGKLSFIFLTGSYKSDRSALHSLVQQVGGTNLNQHGQKTLNIKKNDKRILGLSTYLRPL